MVKSEIRRPGLIDEEISRLIADLKKLIGYASEIEQNIAPSITLMPTLLANLTNELKQTRQALERLIEKMT